MLDSFKKFAISKLNVVVSLPDEILVTGVFSDDELADVGAVIFVIFHFFAVIVRIIVNIFAF